MGSPLRDVPVSSPHALSPDDKERNLAGKAEFVVVSPVAIFAKALVDGIPQSLLPPGLLAPQEAPMFAPGLLAPHVPPDSKANM